MKILVCDECKKLETFPLCSTWRNIIYGCEHEIKRLDEEVRRERPLPIAPRKDMECIDIIETIKPIKRRNVKRLM